MFLPFTAFCECRWTTYFRNLSSTQFLLFRTVEAILTSPNVVSSSDELDPIEESRPAGPRVLPEILENNIQRLLMD